MSFSSAGTAPAKDKEKISEFVYRDSGSPATTTRRQTETLPGIPVPESRKLDDVPRISEQEIARLIAEARTEGFREGQAQALQSFQQKLEEQAQKVADTVAAFSEERAKYYAKVELKLVELSLAIAGKILHREAQVDRMVVAGLVKSILERMQQKTTARVRIAPGDGAAWQHYFNTDSDVTVIEDPNLNPGECRLETELGSAEMGIDAQLKEIEVGFFDLLAQRPGAK